MHDKTSSIYRICDKLLFTTEKNFLPSVCKQKQNKKNNNNVNSNAFTVEAYVIVSSAYTLLPVPSAVRPCRQDTSNTTGSHQSNLQQPALAVN